MITVLSRASSRLHPVVADASFPVLVALCADHCCNDLLQAVVTAAYPMLKADLALSFSQIGLITLVYQIASSVFQPVVGLAFDKRPFVRSLPAGMCSTTLGIVLFAFASSLPAVFVAVFLVGVGSSTLHPEASRITSLAGRGRRGFAQSVFQVGGNFGTSIGPLLVALVVAPRDRTWIVCFVVVALLAFRAMRPICRWYADYLVRRRDTREGGAEPAPARPLPLRKTVWAIVLLMVLIFSKYIYMACLSNYFTFYLIERFGVTIRASQLFLFVFLFATAVGTLVGGPVGDRWGRKPVIWISILGTAPFSLAMPHCGLALTAVAAFCAGFMLSSAFPAILLYSQELLPSKLGLVSGLFFGLTFGVAGIASAVLGDFADAYGIEAVYRACAYTPLLGLVAWFLPNLGPNRSDAAVRG